MIGLSYEWTVVVRVTKANDIERRMQIHRRLPSYVHPLNIHNHLRQPTVFVAFDLQTVVGDGLDFHRQADGGPGSSGSPQAVARSDVPRSSTANREKTRRRVPKVKFSSASQSRNKSS